MAADKNVRMAGSAHHVFAKLSVSIDADIKALLTIAASTPAIMKAIKDEAMRRKK
jgi:hypothetical protein